MKANIFHRPHTLIRQLAPWALVLLGAVVAVAAYLQALDAPFVSDDQIYLTDNAKLAGLQFSELWRLLVEPYNPYEFLPLRDLSYWLDIKLFGLNPAAFRIHNIILYMLCLPLVYAVTASLWRYFRPAEQVGATWAAAVVTALFVLHPAHVEAVVWISGRKDVLAALFSLLALWFAIKAKQGASISVKQQQGLAVRYALAALVALAAALLSKATAVAVAPLIALLWLFFWRDIPPQHRRYSELLWPLASVLVAVFSMLIFSAGHTVKAPPYFGVEVLTRALAALGELTRLAVTPEGRHFYYPGLDDPHLNIMVALGAAVLILAVVCAVLALRRKSLEGFAFIAFVLLCIPYLQLMPYVTSSLVSDRFLALAVWPVVLLIVALASRLNSVAGAILLLLIALSSAYQTVQRPRDWRSFEVLGNIDLRAYPDYFMAAMHKINIQLSHKLFGDATETAQAIADPKLRNTTLGIIQADQAVLVTSAETGMPDQAMAILLKLGYVLQHPPDQISWNPPVQSFWGYCQNRLNWQWQTLAHRFPDNERVHYNAGVWMLYFEKYEAAADHLRAAIGSQRLPEALRGTAYYNYGLALLEAGHVAEAETPLLAALEQSPPESQAPCLLADVYRRSGRSEEAASAEAACRNAISNAAALQ